MSKPRKLKNIFRIETGNTQGWQVRIERRRRQYSRLFSDGVHGSKDAALEAAMAWRDRKIETLPEQLSRTRHLHTGRNKRKAAEAMNRTGVVGIGFSMYTLRDGRKSPYVTCHWRDPESGRRRSSGYSVNKHGLRGALRHACQRLREGRGEEPSDHQVAYYVRKALPGVTKLYEAAEKTRNHTSI